MNAEIDALRAEVLQAVERVFDQFQANTVSEPPRQEQLSIRRLGLFSEEWVYQWPKEQETYKGGTRYHLSWPSGESEALVAWSERHAWGRDRGRIVVFGKSVSPTAETLYPWAEFVETDDGRYAARIPDPLAPRSMLNDRSPLPAEVRDKTVLRADECFGSVKNGPSLRLVLNRNEEEAMLRHAHWVARLRGAVS